MAYFFTLPESFFVSPEPQARLTSVEVPKLGGSTFPGQQSSLLVPKSARCPTGRASDETKNQYSVYYLQARSKMLESRRPPGFPPSAFCLFSQEKRKELKLAFPKANQKKIFDKVRAEWRAFGSKQEFQATAVRYYSEYKELKAEWEESIKPREESYSITTRQARSANIQPVMAPAKPQEPRLEVATLASTTIVPRKIREYSKLGCLNKQNLEKKRPQQGTSPRHGQKRQRLRNSPVTQPKSPRQVGLTENNAEDFNKINNSFTSGGQGGKIGSPPWGSKKKHTKPLHFKDLLAMTKNQLQAEDSKPDEAAGGFQLPGACEASYVQIIQNTMQLQKRQYEFTQFPSQRLPKPPGVELSSPCSGARRGRSKGRTCPWFWDKVLAS